MQLIIATVGECTTETWRWTLIFLRIFFYNKLWAPKSRKMRYMLNLYLQLENLLLDAAGNLKVSDFGLSALTEQLKVPFEYISYDKFSIIVSFCSLFLPCLISYTLILLLIFALKADGLLHTTCGTPNYVAPEVTFFDKNYAFITQY